MFKKPLFLLLVGSLAFGTSCGKKGKLTTESGLEYEIFEDNGKPKAKIGDYITLHVTYKNYKDSLLGTTHAGGKAVTAKVQKAPFKGGLEDGLLLVGAGDSAVFLIPSDSLYKGAPPEQRPKFIPPGSKIKMFVKVEKVENLAGMMDGYKKKNNITQTEKTKTGLEYVIKTKGTGVQPMPGDTVTVDYTGKFLDGKVFDASASHGGEPFKFVVGMGQVIPGWDEGLLLLNEGSEATFIIPSDLAYGEQGSPPTIPGSTPLAFDLKLVKVSKPVAAGPKADAKTPAKHH